MPVPQLGQGFSKLIPLSPMLARAVFDNFSAISSASFPMIAALQKLVILRFSAQMSTCFVANFA
jgi:hypothetical protein